MPNVPGIVVCTEQQTVRFKLLKIQRSKIFQVFFAVLKLFSFFATIPRRPCTHEQNISKRRTQKEERTRKSCFQNPRLQRRGINEIDFPKVVSDALE